VFVYVCVLVCGEQLGRAGSAPSSERNSAIARAERDNVLREVKLMSAIKSEHLIQYSSSFLHQAPGGPQSVFIVMEYAEGGALSDYIKQIRSSASRAEELLIWKCMLQVSSGLAAIHAHRVIHRDIKPANILITAHRNFKVADLGIAVSTSLCNVQGRMRTGRCGTLGYMVRCCFVLHLSHTCTCHTPGPTAARPNAPKLPHAESGEAVPRPVWRDSPQYPVPQDIFSLPPQESGPMAYPQMTIDYQKGGDSNQEYQRVSGI